MSPWMLPLLGLALGTTLSLIGFSDWEQVHRMLTFRDLRLLWVFVGAVGASALFFAAVRRKVVLPERRVHPGTVPGGVVFGVGWAVTGACPAVAAVQLGEGKLFALYTLSGILLGTWLYGKVHARLFRWDVGSCER